MLSKKEKEEGTILINYLVHNNNDDNNFNILTNLIQEEDLLC